MTKLCLKRFNISISNMVGCSIFKTFLHSLKSRVRRWFPFNSKHIWNEKLEKINFYPRNFVSFWRSDYGKVMQEADLMLNLRFWWRRRDSKEKWKFSLNSFSHSCERLWLRLWLTNFDWLEGFEKKSWIFWGTFINDIFLINWM